MSDKECVAILKLNKTFEKSTLSLGKTVVFHLHEHKIYLKLSNLAFCPHSEHIGKSNINHTAIIITQCVFLCFEKHSIIYNNGLPRISI
jgi:hypothetical protein